MSLEEKISALVKKRAGLKSYITVCMKNLNALDVDDLKIHFRARKSTILNYLQKVLNVDESIIEIYDIVMRVWKRGNWPKSLPK